jgi:dTDP-4-amino-4,6-dideoxygalactose transaminase
MGSEVHAFEQTLTKFFGRPAVCVVNGTAAIQLALQSSGIGTGDEVMVPSLTYVASFQAIAATGATPVACDIEPESCILDWRDLERRISARTKAIMPVHYSGGVGDLDGIYDLAAKHGLRVIEDAAHAFGSTHRDLPVGGFGDIACFSFDGIKNITCGEGGCVVSNDQILLGKVRDARLLGVERDTDRRYSGERSWEFDVTAQGWRYHMSNIMAAIGVEQMKRLPELAAVRKRLARRYDCQLKSDCRIRSLPRNYDVVVPHIYVVRILTAFDRPALRRALLDWGIETGIHYQPNHKLRLFRDDRAAPLPVTDEVYPQLLTLPLHPDLTDDDVDLVCAKLTETLNVS